MQEAVELTDVVLRVIGVFYAFAGYVTTRSAMTSRFLDQWRLDPNPRHR